MPNKRIKETVFIVPYSDFKPKKYNTPYYDTETDKPADPIKGFDDLKNILINASNELKDLEVPSKALPGGYAGEGIPLKIALIVSIIEHLSHENLIKRNIQQFKRRAWNYYLPYETKMYILKYTEVDRILYSASKIII